MVHALPPVRVCATAWVVDHHNRILLIKNRKLDLWFPPGGGAEPHEEPITAGLRELFEETGIRADALVPIDVFGVEAHGIERNQLPVCTDQILGRTAVIHNHVWRLPEPVDLVLDDEEVAGYHWQPVLAPFDLQTTLNVIALTRMVGRVIHGMRP